MHIKHKNLACGHTHYLFKDNHISKPDQVLTNANPHNCSAIVLDEKPHLATIREKRRTFRHTAAKSTIPKKQTRK